MARATVALIAALGLVCGCGSSTPAPRPLPPNVRRAPDGTCWYYPPTNCPPAHLSTCEGLPRQRVQCP